MMLEFISSWIAFEAVVGLSVCLGFVVAWILVDCEDAPADADLDSNGG